jgi:hypothetical protein
MISMTMIHGVFPQVILDLEYLYKELLLDEDKITIHPPFTVCTSIDNGMAKVPHTLCLTFEHQRMPPDNEPRVTLWNQLLDLGYDVVWKKDTTGHQIGYDGAILESWDLWDGV